MPRLRFTADDIEKVDDFRLPYTIDMFNEGEREDGPYTMAHILYAVRELQAAVVDSKHVESGITDGVHPSGITVTFAKEFKGGRNSYVVMAKAYSLTGEDVGVECSKESTSITLRPYADAARIEWIAAEVTV